MSNITAKQNTQRQLQRLAAQRQLYVTAKEVFGLRVLLGGPIAAATAFLSLSYPQFTGYVALWGIIVTIADILFFNPWQMRLREQAARIQELFDCDVLRIPWNSIKLGTDKPDPELVKEQADKYETRKAGMSPLENWYSTEVDELPLQLGRLACQRSSCWWDAKLRRRYAVWTVALVSTVFVVVLGLALYQGLSLEDFILKVAAPLSPAFSLGMRQFLEHREAAERLDRIKASAEHLWAEALEKQQEDESGVQARILQDEIFENRKRNPVIFDRVYQWLRRDFEGQMNHGVAELVAEAKQSPGFSQSASSPT